MKKNPPKNYTIDAAGRSVGRVATEAATLLRGKGDANFERHLPGNTRVSIVNASKVRFTGKKMADKYYKHYTGYPGGMRYTSVEKAIEKHGSSELLRHAIQGMLPGNKLRPVIMKNLSIKE